MVDKGNYPRHIGIILDGNRRYAKKLMMQPWRGHNKGADNVEKLLGWCEELNIKELSLYCFSIQNFQRSKDEVMYLMEIFIEKFKKLLNTPKIHELGVKIDFIGELGLLPDDVLEVLNELKEKTKNYSNYIINFCLAYGGQTEILNAAKKMAEKYKNGEIEIKDLDTKDFQAFLWLNSCPDMIIRTGGVFRSSNFLPYQSAYSEWFYLEKTWPEFEKSDLRDCIKVFVEDRKRRFGK